VVHCPARAPQVRKGMVLVAPSVNPQSSWRFTAEVGQPLSIMSVHISVISADAITPKNTAYLQARTLSGVCWAGE
jgi:GTPase